LSGQDLWDSKELLMLLGAPHVDPDHPRAV
jgi:hypothetical protein